VYLAARLGLVRLVTGDRRPPLVFDDPFVTFDDERARRSVELLRALASDFQVIYLTTSDRYDEVADVVIELSLPDARDEGADEEAQLEAAEAERVLAARITQWSPLVASAEAEGGNGVGASDMVSEGGPATVDEELAAAVPEARSDEPDRGAWATPVDDASTRWARAADEADRPSRWTPDPDDEPLAAAVETGRDVPEAVWRERSRGATPAEEPDEPGLEGAEGGDGPPAEESPAEAPAQVAWLPRGEAQPGGPRDARPHVPWRTSDEATDVARDAGGDDAWSVAIDPARQPAADTGGDPAGENERPGQPRFPWED
jgi:hypothetical protein